MFLAAWVIDADASEMLGHEAERIEYLRLASGLLGSADDIEILDG